MYQHEPASAHGARQTGDETMATKTTNVKLTTAQDKLIQRLAMVQFADYKIRFLFTECSLTTFNSLIQKGIVTGEKLDHTHREGYELQLTDVGREYAASRGWLAQPETPETPAASAPDESSAQDAVAEDYRWAQLQRQMDAAKAEQLDAAYARIAALEAERDSLRAALKAIATPLNIDYREGSATYNDVFTMLKIAEEALDKLNTTD